MSNPSNTSSARTSRSNSSVSESSTDSDIDKKYCSSCRVRLNMFRDGDYSSFDSDSDFRCNNCYYEEERPKDWQDFMIKEYRPGRTGGRKKREGEIIPVKQMEKAEALGG